MTATATARPAAPGHLLRDTRLVFARELRPVLRDPFSLVFTLVQPLVFLGLFGPLLGGLPGMAGGASLQWFAPGILVMVVVFGTSATGSNLLFEISTGAHERMLVAPLSRSALLLGRAAKEIAPLLAQALLIILITLPFGFRFSPPGAVAALALLCVLGTGIGALSYALALPLKDREWVFWMVQQTVVFPLLILSGILLPLDMGPGWLQALARANPIGYTVEAIRALFDGRFADPVVLHGALAALAVSLVGIWIGVRGMRRAT